MKRSPLRKLKDAALEKAVLIFARSRFDRYGELNWVNVNTTEKILSAEVLLKGETQPLTVSQAKYRLESKGTQKVLVLYDIKLSREWAQNLLEDRFPEFPIRIPDFVSSLLS
jgi:hypothetical protein